MKKLHTYGGDVKKLSEDILTLFNCKVSLPIVSIDFHIEVNELPTLTLNFVPIEFVPITQPAFDIDNAVKKALERLEDFIYYRTAGQKTAIAAEFKLSREKLGLSMPFEKDKAVRRLDRANKQAKRAANKKLSTKTLETLGIPFMSVNDGAHLKISHNESVIDFWPSTGLWKRPDGVDMRGVYELIKFVQGEV